MDVSHWHVVFHHCTDIYWEAANSLVIAISHNVSTSSHSNRSSKTKNKNNPRLTLENENLQVLLVKNEFASLNENG